MLSRVYFDLGTGVVPPVEEGAFVGFPRITDMEFSFGGKVNIKDFITHLPKPSNREIDKIIRSIKLRNTKLNSEEIEITNDDLQTLSKFGIPIETLTLSANGISQFSHVGLDIAHFDMSHNRNLHLNTMWILNTYHNLVTLNVSTRNPKYRKTINIRNITRSGTLWNGSASKAIGNKTLYNRPINVTFSPSSQYLRELRMSGFDLGRFSVAFQWYGKANVTLHAPALELLDISSTNCDICQRRFNVMFNTNLTYLDISDLNCHGFYPNFLHTLPKLETLICRNLNLNEGLTNDKTSQFLSGLTRLTYIDLSHNELSSFPNLNMFKSSELSLKTIILKGNKFTMIPLCIEYVYRSLQFVDFRENSLTKMSVNDQGTLDLLRNVTFKFSGNPFHCECGVDHHWFRDNAHRVLDFDIIQCKNGISLKSVVDDKSAFNLKCVSKIALRWAVAGLEPVLYNCSGETFDKIPTFYPLLLSSSLDVRAKQQGGGQ